MLRKSFGWAAFLLPAVLGGCLLPQPDTPPVGPMGPGGLISARTGAAKPTAESLPKGAAETAAAIIAAPAAAASAAPLLPQPDTPPIANNAGALISDNAKSAATGSAVAGRPEIGADAMAEPGAPPMPTMVSAPAQGMAQPDFAAPGEQPPMATTKVQVLTGELTVTVRAKGVTEVIAVSTDGLRYARGGETSDDVFAFTLPAGEFYLEIRLNGKVLRVDGPLTVEPDSSRSFILRVTGEPPRASVEEAVALVAPGGQ